jgi:hypothetical protein
MADVPQKNLTMRPLRRSFVEMTSLLNIAHAPSGNTPPLALRISASGCRLSFGTL